MGKDLRLHAGLRHPADLIKRAFPGEHHSVIAEIPGEPCVAGVGKGHLGTGMQLQRGKLVPHQRRHAQILHDHRIGLCGGNRPQRLPHAGKLLFLHQRIDGHVDARMVQVGVFHRAGQRFIVKVHGGSPAPKALEPR